MQKENERATQTVLFKDTTNKVSTDIHQKLLKVLVAKMATSEQTAFWVIQFAKMESTVTVQCDFCIKFTRDPR